MPIVLTAVTWTDDWVGEITDRRTVEFQMEFETKVYLHGPVASVSVIYDSRAAITLPGSTDSDRRDIITLRRGDSDLLGLETGFANQKDSDTVFDSDSVYSPSVINLSDSDGNIIKIVRDINL